MSDLSGKIAANSKINLDQINLQDGPSGVRTPNKTTSWPAGINLASTFNRTLMYNVGKEQGKEFRLRGIHIMLGPCMNMMRTPLGGRMWEAYGEDPFLSGATATEVIKGIQENGVIAVAKHYVGNEVEKNRRNSTSNIPEQALWEIYIEPFYRSVKDADVCSIMSSYNDVNGTLLARNYRLLQTILKDTIGFKGFVMSDWFAIKDNDTDNFNSGEDMNMPGKYSSVDWTRLEEAVNNGSVTEARVNDAARRILGAQYRLDQRSTTNKFPDFDFSVNTINEKNKKLNREAAGQSNVLLKNNGDVLPITKSKYSKIAVLGNDAFPNYCINSPDNLCSCLNDTNEIWDGHLPMGYGSGATIFNYLIDPLSAITEKANNLGISIVSYGKLTSTSETNYNVTTKIGVEDIAGVNNLLAQNTDIDLCLIFIMANSGEELLYLERSHGDRYDMNAWHNGNELVKNVTQSSSCRKKVVVINAPGPINVDTWIDDVDGVVFSGMGGGESGNGLADVLFGDLNPSGHLPYVWGKVDQYPGTINFNPSSEDFITYEYSEGVFVGQRYFDKNNVEPIFPFGYGLSYTTFTFNAITSTYDATKKILTATFNVKNEGDFDGDVVPMLFLKFPTIDEYGADGYPEKLFKGFDKVFIKKGETKSVTITVDEHALSYFSVSENKFKMGSGEYTVYIGLNAKDYNLLTANVNIS